MKFIVFCPQAGRASKAGAFEIHSTSARESGVLHKASPYEFVVRMVSCDKIKRDRASIASPAPFEIPARSLSRQNYRALLRNVCDSLRE
ncbi:MAG TPA: hypothetical protein PLV17_09365, partial [Spirochaetota bacterium]|nr:hypothetical protein [Spirochaetota bacterium]